MRQFRLRETEKGPGYLGMSGSGKAWADLSDAEHRSAVEYSPYVESIGGLARKLDAQFGGWSERRAFPLHAVRERVAEVLTPIHQRYRWYPPRGSTLLDGQSLSVEFLKELGGLDIGGQEAGALSAECGFTDHEIKGLLARRHLALQLPDGTRFLLFIGLPKKGDGRDERIPWLHGVSSAPFERVRGEWRARALACFDSAWRRTTRGHKDDPQPPIPD